MPWKDPNDDESEELETHLSRDGVQHACDMPVPWKTVEIRCGDGALPRRE
jgi:hypothetical protein